MVVDGTTIKAAEFWDEDTKQMIKINLSIRDIVFFRLLQRMEAALRR